MAGTHAANLRQNQSGAPEVATGQTWWQYPALFRPVRRWLLIGILTLHVAMLSFAAFAHSPVMTEVGHLPSGISHWTFGRFDLYHVNPPLVRMVAAVPVLAINPTTDWTHYAPDVVERAESRVGTDFVCANGLRAFFLYTLGRLACIPFSLLGAYVCYRWAGELYGDVAALVACILWCFSPNILGHGALIIPDVPAAAFGAAACYAFWQWLKRPAWTGVLITGSMLGLAELVKTTLIILYPLLPILWLSYRLPAYGQLSRDTWCREAAMLAAQLVIGLYVLNLGYGFEGSFRPLGGYTFRSHMLSGKSAEDLISYPAGNRFADCWIACLPIPLPNNYVQGIDTQKLDFEAGRNSYLAGVWSDHGWWYFYICAAAVKIPLGTWVMGCIAARTILSRWRSRVKWRDELLAFIPLVLIVTMVSAHTGFSLYFRYAFPALPFAFILASRWAADFALPHRKTFYLGLGALIWTVTSSASYYPHSLSYFNELAGGPRNGPRYLLDSNIDWGQDLLYLKQWLIKHPHVKLDGLAYWGSYPANVAGVPDAPYPPTAPKNGFGISNFLVDEFGPRPGWYALSVNYIYDQSGQYRYFLNFHPSAMAGYSIYIYHITLEEANCVRKESGLPELHVTRD